MCTESIIKKVVIFLIYFTRGKPLQEVCHVLQNLEVLLCVCVCVCACLCELELYEYCLLEGYADKNLIAKWKKVKVDHLI